MSVEQRERRSKRAMRQGVTVRKRPREVVAGRVEGEGGGGTKWSKAEESLQEVQEQQPGLGPQCQTQRESASTPSTACLAALLMLSGAPPTGEHTRFSSQGAGRAAALRETKNEKESCTGSFREWHFPALVECRVRRVAEIQDYVSTHDRDDTR